MAGPSGKKFAKTLNEHRTMDTITIQTHTHAHTQITIDKGMYTRKNCPWLVVKDK